MEIEDLLQTKQDLEKQLVEQKTNGPCVNNEDMMKEWRQIHSENVCSEITMRFSLLFLQENKFHTCTDNGL